MVVQGRGSSVAVLLSTTPVLRARGGAQSGLKTPPAFCHASHVWRRLMITAQDGRLAAVAQGRLESRYLQAAAGSHAHSAACGRTTLPAQPPTSHTHEAIPA